MREVDSAAIKGGSLEQLQTICKDVREEIFRTVLANGGHLASNLGAVELTVALHHVFSFPKDKLVFDVGHQCYTHKLLSGRASQFHTLRKEGGISGFPKREESEFDCYDTGHAGTALSAALGIAKARDIKKEDFEVVAFIGDGAFQNGLIYEALNSISILHTRILIVLNDNGMSISRTEGGTQEILEGAFSGDEESIRLLERFGLTYLPVSDGNSLEEVLPALMQAKELLRNGCVLLHAHTQKGRGHVFCENAPTLTHGIVPVKEGETLCEFSAALGKELMELAEEDNRVVAVTAAMTDSLGLRPFFERFPERAFDVGICEEHATVLCAALASEGLRPFYGVYSTFLQRSVDEIIHDICGQDLPVTICVDRAGITGADGETHQGVFDLSLLTPIPGIAIAIPKDVGEFRAMLRASLSYPHPLVIRYPREGREGTKTHVKIGSFEMLRKGDGRAILLVAGGRCLAIAEKIAQKVAEKGLSLAVVNARFAKPLDEAFLRQLQEESIYTLEDNIATGGIGDAVARFYRGSTKRVTVFGYRDAFIPQGEVSSLMRRFGLDEEEIVRVILGDACR